MRRTLLALADGGDHDELIQLIEGNIVETWFALSPLELNAVLRLVPAETVRRSAICTYLLALTGGPDRRDPGASSRPPSGVPSTNAERLMQLTEAADLRFRGRCRAALRVARRRLDDGAANALVDTTHGWQAFLDVQKGVTALLAGEFATARADFFAAMRARPPEALRFLTRDAHVKLALLEAIVGDPRVARVHLQLADGVERTDGWVEAVVDASAAVAQAVLDDSEHALDVVPPNEIGEMWPFLFWARWRLLERRGEGRDASAWLSMYEASPPAGAGGDGMFGSCIPLARARHSLAEGDVRRAREALASADPQFVLTTLVDADISLMAGDAARALALARSIPGVDLELRGIARSRAVMMAAALRALGDEGAARRVLMTELPGADSEIALPPVSVGWDRVPAGESSVDRLYDGLEPVRTNVTLTRAEREVVALLAQGQTRAEMAQVLFVSPNTVKSHLTRIYRKLDAANQREALARAEELGLV